MYLSAITRPVILVALISLATGCAAMKRSSEQRRIRDARTQDHIYAQNCPSVLSAAREIAFDRGMSVKDSDTGTLTIETDWAASQRRGSNVRERYLIRGSEPSAEECAISVRRQEKNANSARVDSDRDLDFEWELLGAADPDAAADIRAELDAVP